MNKIHEWITIGLILLVGVLVLVGGNNQSDISLGATRYPRGVSVGTTTQAVDRQLLVGATSTFPANAGNFSYRTSAGIDFADIQIPYEATSSIACRIVNPYGAATTSMLLFIGQNTVGVTGANLFTLSTTSNAQGFGSSTRALINERSVGSLAQDTAVWTPRNTSTTSADAVDRLLQADTNDGVNPFILGPNEALSWRIATGSPGTFAAYYTGTCSASFMKP